MRKRNDYNEITNAVRVLATEYQYNVVQDQWYLRLDGAMKPVTDEDVNDVVTHLATEAYAVNDRSTAGKSWIAQVCAQACVSPETTVLMWMQEAIELNVCGMMRGCDLHAVWADDHGIYDSPAPFNYYKTSPDAYTAQHRAQAKRFYETLEREGRRYGIRNINTHAARFTGCTLRPPRQVPDGGLSLEQDGRPSG